MDPKIDPYASFGFIKNPDGSLTRKPGFFPTSPASSDPANPVLSKDITINPEKKTWARIYLPRRGSTAGAGSAKFPLIVYYHGGGFIIGSPETRLFHKFCSDMAGEIPAVIVSVEYRLAPEHRLPAAYEDGVEALHWVKAVGDEWLTEYADFTRCYLVGDSAGANLVYHVGLRVVTCVDDLMPLKIQGLILHHPFFGGVQRTASEIRLADDKMIPLAATDVIWSLALPIDADRDHEYCNSIAAVELDLLEKLRNQGWKILVMARQGDPMFDRQTQFVKILKENGVDVIDKFSDEGTHGIELFDESQAKIYYGILKNFVLSL